VAGETRIEVYEKSGEWRWRKREGDKPGDRSDAFDSRRDAFEDALLERIDEPIVLLRGDGSVHGELYHGGNRTPQDTSLKVHALAADLSRHEGASDGS
jgi:hypothetical protein